MDKELIKKIKTRIKEKLASYPPEAAVSMLGLAERTCFSGYEEEIALLPARTFAALGKENTDQSTSIGAAHCFGWTAYRLLDEVADGKSRDIWLALSFYRLMITEYKKLAGINDEGFIESVFSKMDTTNHLEKENLGVPTMAMLADKSMGHALGVLVPLGTSGYGSGTAAFRLAFVMMRHMIIARQLSDDMQDWQEDFEMCIRTRVNHPLFEKRLPEEKRTALDRAMRDACAEIMRHSHAAARLARANPAFGDPSFFVRLAMKFAGPARNFLTKKLVP